ncbi:hypothetical protein KY284_020896 [Solanum tuberosum]|nr:hypothetical protein KY284_020896 [Solanum tuberosum]
MDLANIVPQQYFFKVQIMRQISSKYKLDGLYIQNYTVIAGLDGGQKTGCYNNICPGFVQLDNEVPIDYAFPKISRRMYDDYELQLQIYKDEDYYLFLHYIFVIGFWPETIFNELRNGSQTV